MLLYYLYNIVDDINLVYMMYITSSAILYTVSVDHALWQGILNKHALTTQMNIATVT